MSYSWDSPKEITVFNFTCGHCGKEVGPSKGYFARWGKRSSGGRILICPTCSKPTFFDVNNKQFPAVRFGREVKGITDTGVQNLYNEARDCTSLAAFTAAVLVCRKILMNLAVEHGAEEGISFVSYVDHLVNEGYVPPNGREWVDRIRKKANVATHEIPDISREDAEQLLGFVEMLLRFNYEFPAMIAEDDD